MAPAPVAALGLMLFFMPPISGAFTSVAHSQPALIAKSQSEVLNTYNIALSDFRSILGQRRAQINSNQRLPNLPGQALYLARINMMSTYKDLTDTLPSRIGRPINSVFLRHTLMPTMKR